MKKYFYSEPTFTSSTWALLAITRFFLAFIVMIGNGHLDKFTDVGKLFSVIREFGGKAAVIVFLMISGISVGRSIMKNKDGFLKRRFLRIYPLYFSAVLVTVFLQYYLGSPYLVRETNYVVAGLMTSMSNFLLLQGIASLTILYNGPLWSIGVEFFLYLILPILYVLRLKYVYLIATLSVIFYIAHSHLFSISLYGIQHIMYAWPFIIGFLIAVKKQFWGVIPLILMGSLGMYYNFTMEVVCEKYSFIWLLLTVTIVLCFIYVKIDLSKNVKIVFNYLGTISYPLYLFHIPLYFILYHIGIQYDYIFVTLSILLCIPINYIFDVWLKKIFWEPFVENIDARIKEFKIKRISNKTLKA
jgi:peptidoglycan/LPS O-acetylase OafA/YrhL